MRCAVSRWTTTGLWPTWKQQQDVAGHAVAMYGHCSVHGAADIVGG